MSSRPAAPETAGSPLSGEGLTDGFGRIIDYLRISVTDRCNLRCVYCMPLGQADVTEHDGLLSADEIETLVRCAVDVGFRKFRLTGGEPTLRRDIVDIVRRIAAVAGVADLSMTTNGTRLTELAEPLREAGLQRVNVHVDTLSARTLPRIMRLGSLPPILAGIEAAERAGLTPIKLNVVVVRGMNEEHVADLAALTLDRAWHVRFIELMPLGSSDEARLAVTHYVSNGDTRRRIEGALGALEPVAASHRSDESENFRLPGAAGVVGLISPVSRPYCGSCNRMRLTPDGRFHLCLLRDDDLDVRAALRRSQTVAEKEVEVREILRRAVSGKPMGHRLDQGLHTRSRRMHQLGG